MAALETVFGFLGAGGGLSGMAAIVKAFLDKSGLEKKIVDLETVALPALRAQITAAEGRITDAIAKLPALEQRAEAAAQRVEAAVRSARSVARQSGGDGMQVSAAMAELASLRREVEALRSSVDAIRQHQPMVLQRLDALESRFGEFERAYHDDYAELVEKVAGVTGEFKQAMRSRYARPSTTE